MVEKNQKNIWDIHVDNIVISKLVETENDSKYLIGYADNVRIPLVLILSKTNRHVEKFKVKSLDKDKKNNLFLYR